MYSIKQTDTFAKWLSGLRDARAKARIVARLRMAGSGNLGDVKGVGNGVSEMRVDVGPGYRLYYTRRGDTLIVLLVGATRPRRRATFSARRNWRRRFEHD